MEPDREAQEFAAASSMRRLLDNQLMWSLAIPYREALFDSTMVVMDDTLREYHLKIGMAATIHLAGQGLLREDTARLNA